VGLTWLLARSPPYGLGTSWQVRQIVGSRRRPAAAAFEDLPAGRLRVLGPYHFDTLTTRDNLAEGRGRARLG
jgi:hypothetical protein